MDEVYIKKSDLLEKVVTEEMGDFVEREIVHLCDINKCATYTKQVSLEEVAEYCNNRNIEMVAREWLDDLNDDLKKYKGAYDYIYEGVMSKIEECENETELLTADLKTGERGVGLSQNCFAVRVKKELLREIIDIVDEALEEGSAE